MTEVLDRLLIYSYRESVVSRAGLHYVRGFVGQGLPVLVGIFLVDIVDANRNSVNFVFFELVEAVNVFI